MRWLPIVLCLSGCGASVPVPLPSDGGSHALDAASSDAAIELDAGRQRDAGVIEDAGPSAFDPHWIEGPDAPPSEVEGRWGAVTVYVPGEELVIVHGGSQYPRPTSDETWVFDLRAQRWSELETQDAPPPRYCHCGVYLPETRELLVVNGRNEQGALPRAAWTLSLETRRWTTVEGELPPGAIGCNAVYDPREKRALVFGGQARASLSNQTHVYDPVARTFTRLLTDSSPPARRDALLIHDPVGGKVWLHAGQVARGHLNDTWSFDGSDWTQVEVPEPLPPGRRWSAHGLDARGNWVFFGGTDEQESFDDLWVMNLGQPGWRRLELEGAPDGRAGASHAWLPDEDALWLFGGFDLAFQRSLSDGHKLRFGR
jgi:hypothetical protein